MAGVQLKRKLVALTLAIVLSLSSVVGADFVRLNGQMIGTLVTITTLVMTGVAKFANGASNAPSITAAGSVLDGWFWTSTGHWVYTSQATPSIDFGSGVSVGSAGGLGITSTANPAGGSTDTTLTRAGVGIWSTSQLRLTTPAITTGAATGITVNDTGSLRQEVYKVTVDTTALICAAVTCDLTLATLPAKTFVTHAMVDVAVAFTCASVCTTATLSATLGKTVGGAEYLASYDADAAVARFGTTAAQLGASLTGATVPTEIGDLASWTATTPVSMRFTSGTGNIGTGAATNLGAGSMTFYITTIVMP